MKRALAWLAGVVAVVAVVVAFAPASLVAGPLAAATHGELRLANARGTIWNGTADVTSASGRCTLPLAWRLQAWPLVAGEARIALRPVDGSPGATANVILRRGAIEARDVAFAVPASSLRLPAGTLAGGEVRVTAEAATFAPDGHQGRVHVEWTRARLALPGVGPFDLGTASATLTGDGAGWRGPLQARGGVLVVDGTAGVNDIGADVALALVPQPGTPQALRMLLGPADAQGAIRLTARSRSR